MSGELSVRGVAMLLLFVVAVGGALAGGWHLMRGDVLPRAGLTPGDVDGGPLWWPSRARLSAEGRRRRAKGARLLTLGLSALALMFVLALFG